LTDPAVKVPGTTMIVAGMPDPTDRANLIAYLRLLATNPIPLTAQGLGVVVPGLGALAFTAEQAVLGRNQYRRCSSCHHESLRGEWQGSTIGFARPLVGEHFAKAWFARPVYELFSYMQVVNLPDRNGTDDHAGLPPEIYLALLAFILERNGFAPGDQPLPADPAALQRMGFWQ
jgi:hypothetical protein